MKEKFLVFKIILFSLLGLFTFSATAFGQNGDDNAAKAKTFIDMLAEKDFANAYDRFAAELKAKLPAEAMPQIWAQITGEFGQFQKRSEVIKSSDDKKLVLIGSFEKADAAFLVLFDDAGKIRSFRLDEKNTTRKNAPKYDAPDYANPNSFTEKEVTVGAGEWILPATLTVPAGAGNFPAVVLVHGSGAGDRDETHINKANKPFKDLALGLASMGVAVLRYDKRTKEHGAKFAAAKNYTVKEETVDDALAAVEFLRKTERIDPKKIYVLGHSLGGYLIPRIGARDHKIAGFISFAGATRPLEDVILEQNTYFAKLDGAISKEDQAGLDQLKQTVAQIKSLNQTDRDSSKSFFGLPASYWIDLKNYNPSAEAKSLKQPILVVQGERDYQVTMTNFQNWKNALGSKKSATFKTYPKLNHLFMSGEGVPRPADYEKTNHVSAEVINDIAAWILKAKK